MSGYVVFSGRISKKRVFCFNCFFSLFSLFHSVPNDNFVGELQDWICKWNLQTILWVSWRPVFLEACFLFFSQILWHFQKNVPETPLSLNLADLLVYFFVDLDAGQWKNFCHAKEFKGSDSLFFIRRIFLNLEEKLFCTSIFRTPIELLKKFLDYRCGKSLRFFQKKFPTFFQQTWSLMRKKFDLLIFYIALKYF